jgi:tetratricopeptide (TPR) repeat protein
VALLFKKSGALLLLAPKTGSTWIRAKVKALGLAVETLGDPALREHDRLQDFDRGRYPVIGAFVRNPISWYMSYWAYRRERGWRPAYALDQHCADEAFETFVRRAVSILPGALTNILESYVGPRDHPVDFIGRQERLAEDFGAFLTLIGEEFDPAALSAGPVINATAIRADYDEALKELVTWSEWELMDRFGYALERPDPVGLQAMLRRYPAHAADLRFLILWTERIHWEPDDRKRARGLPVAPETRHARIHSNFALFCQYKVGDPEQARLHYERALALDPRHPRTLCNYGLFLWEHGGDPAAARGLMERAVSVRPNHPYTLGKLARLLDRAFGDPEEAETFYRRSLAANPRQEEVALELADLLLRRERNSEAGEVLKAAAADLPDAPRILASYANFLTIRSESPEAALALLGPHVEGADVHRLLLAAQLAALRRCGAGRERLEPLMARLASGGKERPPADAPQSARQASLVG